VRDAIEQMREQIGEVMTADDIARSIVYAVSQPQHVAVNEILIRPTQQRR
jgi:NADP-dependent 3-hydroxy acid dehydrogenase YdfG